MDILLDTNILGRYLDADSVRHQTTISCTESLVKQGYRIVLTPQVIAEFICVATRPRSSNGLGIEEGELQKQIHFIQQAFHLHYPNSQKLHEQFLNLRVELKPLGKKVHDLRHVAAAKTLGIGSILTYNVKDFEAAARAGHIKIITPEDVLRQAGEGTAS
jgi:predicted nucleic acid-binding protein